MHGLDTMKRLNNERAERELAKDRERARRDAERTQAACDEIVRDALRLLAFGTLIESLRGSDWDR